MTHPSSLADLFQPIVRRATFPKNHLLHREGNVCHHLYLIEKGIARSYYYKDGKDVTAHFAMEGGTITAIDSFIQRKRSKYNIELLEESVVAFVSREDVDAWLDQHPAHERPVRLFMEQIYIDLAERTEDLLFYGAQERYTRLIKNNPSLLQRVSLGHIASYLGITPETLSRVRSQSW